MVLPFFRNRKKIHANQYTILPMDQRVVDRVNELGILQKQKPINDSGFEYSWRPDGPAIDNIEPSDVSLPVDVAQGAGGDGVDDEGTAQGAENDDDPSLPEHEDQGAAILPTTTFADPSSLRANDFTYSSNYSSSPLSDNERQEVIRQEVLPPPPSDPAVIDLTDVDDSEDSEEDSVSPPVIKPDPEPGTNNAQINSTRNDAGGRYNLRNLSSNNVNYKSLNEVGKQYVQIKKEKKERKKTVCSRHL